MFMTLLPHMFFAAAHVYRTCFLLPHMYTPHDFHAAHVHDFTAAHVEQFWLIRVVVIRAIIHFGPNCETAKNVFKNGLIQGLSQKVIFCQLLDMRQAVGIFVSTSFFELSQLNISRPTS